MYYNDLNKMFRSEGLYDNRFILIENFKKVWLRK